MDPEPREDESRPPIDIMTTNCLERLARLAGDRFCLTVPAAPPEAQAAARAAIEAGWTPVQLADATAAALHALDIDAPWTDLVELLTAAADQEPIPPASSDDPDDGEDGVPVAHATPEEAAAAKAELHAMFRGTPAVIEGPVRCRCLLASRHGQQDGAAAAHARLLAIEQTGPAGLAELVSLIVAAAYCEHGEDEDPAEPLYALPVRLFVVQHPGAFDNPIGVRQLLGELLDLAAELARSATYQEKVQLLRGQVEVLRATVHQVTHGPITPAPNATDAAATAGDDLTTPAEAGARLHDYLLDLIELAEEWQDGHTAAGEAFAVHVAGVQAIAERLAQATWPPFGATGCQHLSQRLHEAIGLLDAQRPADPESSAGIAVVDDVTRQLLTDQPDMQAA